MRSIPPVPDWTEVAKYGVTQETHAARLFDRAHLFVHDWSHNREFKISVAFASLSLTPFSHTVSPRTLSQQARSHTRPALPSYRAMFLDFWTAQVSRKQGAGGAFALEEEIDRETGSFLLQGRARTR